jgi:hypothetical protein
MFGSSTTHLHKLVVRVFSQVVNTFSVERCWSSYSFIHIVKRKNLNADQAKSLVYVHYNLRLLSHYFEAVKNDKTYVSWDDNPEEANLEDGAIVLEHLEVELLGDHIYGVEMPSASISRFLDVGALPLASQHPALCGGHVATGRVPRTLPSTPTPLVHRSREKN